MNHFRLPIWAACSFTIGLAALVGAAVPEERQIRVTVKDHTGKPMKDVRIYPLEDGKSLLFEPGYAVRAFELKEDKTKTYFTTDAHGQADVKINKESRLALTHAKFQAWAVNVLDTSKLTVTLPEPATVEVIFDIDGADKETVLFYQLLTGEANRTGGAHIETSVKLKQRKTVFRLPPGPYQFCRRKTVRQKQMSQQLMIDRQHVVLKEGQSHQVNFVRRGGAAISGVVDGCDGYEAVLIHVKRKHETDVEKAKADLYRDILFDVLRAGTYNKQNELQDRRAAFTTDSLLPGTYVVEVHGYKPVPLSQRFSTGRVVPAQVKKQVVVVPKSGTLEAITIAFD